MDDSSSDMSAEEISEAMGFEVKIKETRTEQSQEISPRDSSEEAAGSGVITAETVNSEAKTDKADLKSTGSFVDRDPEVLLQFVNNHVKVQLERNYSYVGFVHAIDPMTHSVVLSVPKDGTYKTTLIPGTSILDMTMAPQDSSITLPKQKQIPGLSQELVLARKRKVVSWLKDNLLPVTEEGENVVFGGITLIPPYDDRSICTTNPLIALEIRKIISRMPQDYEPK